MVLADVHCIMLHNKQEREAGMRRRKKASMNHYDMVTAFYSLQQSVEHFLMHHFIQILKFHKTP